MKVFKGLNNLEWHKDQHIKKEGDFHFLTVKDNGKQL